MAAQRQWTVWADTALSAWRSLAVRPVHTGLNISGLGVGFLATILILLFVREEMSYDRFFTKADDLYRIVVTYSVPGRSPIDLVSSPPPAAPGLATALREITHAARMIYQGETIEVDGRIFTDTVSYVDPAFLGIFDLPFVEGRAVAALNRPDGIILSQSLAERYFPDRAALGEVLHIRTFDGAGRHRLTVTGVLADLPTNTHLAFNALAPIGAPSNGWTAQTYREWTTANLLTYVRVAPGTDRARFQQRVRDWSLTAIPDIEMMGTTLESGSFAVLDAQPVPLIHLTSDRQGEVRPPGSLTAVVTLTVTAIVILVIGAINFMNLTTVQIVQRSKEISIRKVFGAGRRDLILQIVLEAVLISLAALVLAIAASELVLPAFNTFLDRTFYPPYTDPGMLVELIAVALAVALAGSAYPAWLAIRMDPIRSLKKDRVTGGLSSAQAALVAVQFAAATTLIIATLTAQGQLQHARGLDTGWDKSNMVVVSGLGREPALSKTIALKEMLRTHPAVEAVTLSTAVPTEEWEGNMFVKTVGTIQDDAILMRTLTVAPDFFATYGIAVLGGENALTILPGNGPYLLDSLVLTASAARQLGFADPVDAVGALVFAGTGAARGTPRFVTAVVGDLHFQSARDAAVPMVFSLDRTGFWDMSIRLAPHAQAEGLAAIDGAWAQLMGGRDIQRRFLEDSFDALYTGERRQTILLGLFSVLTLFVSCLGLFGLAGLAASQRTKEIGIRRALGAGPRQILILMVGQLAVPVLLANLIAWPLAFVLMDRWLDRFAYRIDVSPALLLAASGIALTIAMIPVLVHAMRAILPEPADALRYE